MKKIYYLLFAVILYACGNETPKYNYRVVYEFEDLAKVSANEQQGTIGTLNKRLDMFASNYEVKFNNKQQIEVKLHTDFDVERLNSLLTNSGKLEFWEVMKDKDVTNFLSTVNNAIPKEHDTVSLLYDLLELPSYSAFIGVKSQDTSEVRRILNLKEVHFAIPAEYKNSKVLFGKPDDEDVVGLYVVKLPVSEKAFVDETHIVEVRQVYNFANRPAVSMQMNAQGAGRWERMTNSAYQNQSQIAITLNDIVYSAPGVSSGAIVGGNTEISGEFTVGEAQDLALILSSGHRIPKLKFVNSSAIND